MTGSRTTKDKPNARQKKPTHDKQTQARQAQQHNNTHDKQTTPIHDKRKPITKETTHDKRSPRTNPKTNHSPKETPAAQEEAHASQEQTIHKDAQAKHFPQVANERRSAAPLPS